MVILRFKKRYNAYWRSDLLTSVNIWQLRLSSPAIQKAAPQFRPITTIHVTRAVDERISLVLILLDEDGTQNELGFPEIVYR